MPSPDFDNRRMISNALVPLAIAFGLSSCVLFQNPQGVALSTDPPGAAVYVDQKPTGFATPCVLAFDPSEEERIDFVLNGYQTETRFVTSDHEVYAILWREMSVEWRTWEFPLFLNVRDFFTPVKIRETCSPGRIHVRLDRVSDAPTVLAPSSVAAK
jgi:hypothetical protein